jgi:uncharacterized phage protein (TIGR01671 family)
MRELKYRVYDPNQKKLVYFDLHNITVSDNLLCQHYYPVQQYTGLTDSNDKEIYEGDILKIPFDVGGDVIGQVLYEADHGGYIFQWKRKGPNQDYNNLNCDLAFESVIIGNIFEHRELLK